MLVVKDMNASLLNNWHSDGMLQLSQSPDISVLDDPPLSLN